MRNWLKKTRIEKGLTQNAIAESLGIAQSYYNMIENNERQRKMSVAFAEKLASALGVSPEFVIKNELSQT